MTVYEDYETGSIKINKTSEDNVVKDIEFKVTGSDGSSYTEKTNSSGVAEFSGLKVYNSSTGKAITYTVSEINVASRYETPKAQNVTLANGNVDLTVNLTFINDLVKGNLKINKQSEDGENGDREFTIAGGGKTYTIKTGSDGIAILSDIPVYDSNNEKIVYTISEKNVPIKYVVPADQTATLTADATTTKTFQNVLKKFTAEVVKRMQKPVPHRVTPHLQEQFTDCIWMAILWTPIPLIRKDISRQRNMFAAIIRFRKSRRPKDICWMRRCIPLAQKPRIIRWKAI